MVSRLEKVERYEQNKTCCELIIDNFADPHNVAAIARTADGLGVKKIHLYYTRNSFPNLKTIGKKSSASANKWMTFEKIGDLDSFIKHKKEEGYTVIGTDFCTGADNVVDFKFNSKTLIVMGSEHSGMSAELRTHCDGFVFIPLVGMVGSYNVSVAAGIILYEFFKQHGTGLTLRSFLLSREERKV